jgi:hypothetical protein
MPAVSPTLEGFRAAFHRPSLTFAEIAWRWTAGAVACALCLFWSIEYLDTLPVSSGDATLLGTKQPLLVGRAIAHILRGSLNRAALAAFLAALALAAFWIIAASLGRAATVRALLDYFRTDIFSGVSASCDAVTQRPFPSLLGLNFLRVALALIALLALVGAASLASLVSSDANPRPGLALFLFLPLAALICLIWPTLNWFLSLACIFAIREGDDTFSALAAAINFSRERSGAVFAVSAWTGLAHLVAFSAASTAVSFPLAFVAVTAARVVVAVVILLTLAYFAVVDWLYMARLAGYVCIAEMPAVAASSELSSVPPLQTWMDRDEPILSDVPNLAVET